MVCIREINNQLEWETFLSRVTPDTFMQSWQWGKFYSLMGNKIWRLGMYTEDDLVGIVLVVKIEARRGTFLFIPHGPIFSGLQEKKNLYLNQEQIVWLEVLGEYLKGLAKKEGCSFVRVSPLIFNNAFNEKVFNDLGWRRAPIHMVAELFWILDVRPPEEQLLMNMRKTTRYLIRRAYQCGVEIIKSDNPNDLKIFLDVYKETAQRQHFTPFSEDFLLNEFLVFNEMKQSLFFFAKYKEEVISAAMIIFYGNSAFYHHGASSMRYPKISAPYLLQWEVIREAKRRGLFYYNFWGIAPENKPSHPWAGLSLFKKGFGGFSAEYLVAQDLIIKPTYWLNYVVEWIRKYKRGF
jgi:lipid II:glycine glycyltransferase (peptidoglycan interpeptide bridge formation enzyme)